MSTTKKRSRANSGRLVVLNEEELIRQVSLRPILYDRSLKAYRKSGLRLQFWKEVASEMNATVEECRRRWRSLRDAFSKHFKHTNRCEAEGTQAKRKKWVFYDQMSFMASFLDNASCEIDEQLLDDFADNSEDTDGIMLLPGEDCEVTSQNENETTQEQQAESTTTPTKCNNNVTTEAVDEDEDHKYVESLLHNANVAEPSCFLPLREKSNVAVAENVTTSEQEEVHEVHEEPREHATLNQTQHACSSTNTSSIRADIDSNEKFLLSCAATLRRLTHRQNALARLKIQQILYDIEFGSAADN